MPSESSSSSSFSSSPCVEDEKSLSSQMKTSTSTEMSSSVMMGAAKNLDVNNSDIVCQEEEEEEEEEKSDGEDDKLLQPGDHIYVWNGPFGGQTHGIVLEAPERNNAHSSCLDDEDFNQEDYGLLVTVLTFYQKNSKNNNTINKHNNEDEDAADTNKRRRRNLFRFPWGRSNSNDENNKDNNEHSNDTLVTKNTPNDDDDDGDNDATHLEQTDIVKLQSLHEFCSSTTTCDDDDNNLQNSKRQQKQPKLKPYYKVRYNASRAKRLLSRAGTATCIPADPRGIIVARMKHLWQHPRLLPPPCGKYVFSDECAVVWCCTGRWVTLQGASILELLASSHAASAVVAAGVVPQIPVTYLISMAPGLVWTWTVPTVVAYPVVIPLLVAYGLTSMIPFLMLRKCREKWSDISDELNRHFWAKALSDDPSRMEFLAQQCATAPNLHNTDDDTASQNNTSNNNYFIQRFFGTWKNDDKTQQQQQHTIRTSDQYEDDKKYHDELFEIGEDNDHDDSNPLLYMPLNMEHGIDNIAAANFDLNAPTTQQSTEKGLWRRFFHSGRNNNNNNNNDTTCGSSVLDKQQQEHLDKMWKELKHHEDNVVNTYNKTAQEEFDML